MKDTTTCIDYILKVTGQDSLYYIGYSMGTTVFFVMTSVLPEYNAKVKAMAAMAPVAYFVSMALFVRNGTSLGKLGKEYMVSIYSCVES